FQPALYGICVVNTLNFQLTKFHARKGPVFIILIVGLSFPIQIVVAGVNLGKSIGSIILIAVIELVAFTRLISHFIYFTAHQIVLVMDLFKGMSCTMHHSTSIML